jgi:hypothetical protein
MSCLDDALAAIGSHPLVINKAYKVAGQQFILPAL